ncbi:hypothetical protein CEUSTIGMA_g1596.t1 [Chlamydomonas eustigma]|uniref:Homologous recombination OB-fold protein OB-fold domain-containing protein n=1 Tax=Chlamydomonas eustigma TaxID=1157962 RepID=A0A250WTK2_9CHLO|nr:hypothetical protein CEUSTIGMA_g1596.t1 [Chlamydomonas eustigma]|eukprot:GAX74147.1 hypothetical protein CEUSTIGMA_g1596.t1 [Chlamydomonas eustigma]
MHRKIPGPAGGSTWRPLSTSSHLESDETSADILQRRLWENTLKCLDIPSEHNKTHPLMLTNVNEAKQKLFQKIPNLVCIIHSMSMTPAGEIFATLKDPSGAVHAAMDKAIIAEEPDMCVGAALVLQQVSVFGQHWSSSCLCITADNIMQVIPPPSTAPKQLPEGRASAMFNLRRHGAQNSEIGEGCSRKQSQVVPARAEVLKTAACTTTSCSLAAGSCLHSDDDESQELDQLLCPKKCEGSPFIGIDLMLQKKAQPKPTYDDGAKEEKRAPSRILEGRQTTASMSKRQQDESSTHNAFSKQLEDTSKMMLSYPDVPRPYALATDRPINAPTVPVHCNIKHAPDSHDGNSTESEEEDEELEEPLPSFDLLCHPKNLKGGASDDRGGILNHSSMQATEQEIQRRSNAAIPRPLAPAPNSNLSSTHNNSCHSSEDKAHKAFPEIHQKRTSPSPLDINYEPCKVSMQCNLKSVPKAFNPPPENVADLLVSDTNSMAEAGGKKSAANILDIFLGLSQAVPEVKRQRLDDVKDNQQPLPVVVGNACKSSWPAFPAAGPQRQLSATPRVFPKCMGESTSLKNALLSSLDEDLDLDDI